MTGGGGESKGLKQLREMCDFGIAGNHNNNTLLGLLTTLSGRRCSRWRGWGVGGGGGDTGSPGFDMKMLTLSSARGTGT